MIIDQDTAEDFTPTVLLQKDGVKYYNDSDIPCISKDEYGYGTNVLISEKRACSKKNVNNKLWMVCLVTNTIPKCLRCEVYSDGGMILNDPYHSECSSWYKWNNPKKGDDYDTRCKKIAWGIAAYIGYCCWIDKNGELDWKKGTLEDLYREYHDEAIELAKRMNEAYSKAMRHNDNQTMQIIGDDIEEQHIQQEEAFIKQSSELENVLGKPVLDAAKGYLQWLQKDRNLNLQPQQMELKDLLSEELKTDKAQRYFSKAIELGLMSPEYKWLMGLQLLACFVREMNIHLELDKGGRISWRPFEVLFELKKGKLRSNYNDIQKTGQSPLKIELVDEVFK